MESAKFRLVKVDATDPVVWARITAMDAQCFADGSPAIANNEGAWWIAYAPEGQEAGYCGVKPLPNGGGAYLCRAGVLWAFRGLGLQKQMIKRRFAYARKRGWLPVVTDTHQNIASANSLMACGFRLYAPEEKWAFDNSLYWKRKE